MNDCARVLAALLAAQLVLPADLMATGKRPGDGEKVSLQHAGEAQVVHALNRLTFGPRPHEIEQVERTGLETWFEQQLHPEKISDAAMDARLAEYPAMQLSEQQLIEKFPPPELVRAMMNGRGPAIPAEEPERAIYQRAIERYRLKQEEKAVPGPSAGVGAGAVADARRGKEEDPAVQAVVELPPDERMARLTAMPAAQFDEFRKSMTGRDKLELVTGLSGQQREVLVALAAPRQVVVAEAQQTKMLRAIESNRELLEVMTDFWSNHFSVYIEKNGMAPYYVATYERDTIRPHALGKFEDLLVATAQSPAMLNYLDNTQSIGPNSLAAMRRQRSTGKQAGLNENYARELMELHTLGVNGGYTQQDVTEVAKVFTGWSAGDLRSGFGQYEFDPRRHEPGAKHVLGKTISEGGEAEGRAVLHMLATSPQTAHFISTKLAVRFVRDDPPPALVNRMAATFVRSGGDIREVLRTMVHSPEFWSAETVRAKVKTPVEYVVSAVRASGASVENPEALVREVANLGQPLYGMQTPNGYSQKAEAWVSSGSLVGRMNFALALAANRVPGVAPDWAGTLGNAPVPGEEKAGLLEKALLGAPAAPSTHATIEKQLAAGPGRAQAGGAAAPDRGMDASLDRQRAKGQGTISGAGFLRQPLARAPQPVDPETALIAGLLFGSPDFQRF